jgi:hypothetical protein
LQLYASLSAFALCRAYIVPTDLEDGLYYVPLDDDGVALGAPILLEAPIELADASFDITRRQPNLPSPSVNCHDRSYNGGDYEVAKRAFNDNCDKGTYYPSNYALWYTAGSAIAYLCNYESSNRCWRKEFDEANALMDISCGTNRVGWVSIDSYKKSYGRDNSGAKICW